LRTPAGSGVSKEQEEVEEEEEGKASRAGVEAGRRVGVKRGSQQSKREIFHDGKKI